MKQCFALRPSGKRCTNPVPPENKMFCNRCDQENFKTKPQFQAEDVELEKPNTYEPEPVEVTFNAAAAQSQE